MRRTISVLSVLFCLLCAADSLAAQSGQTSGFQLDQNYPNPFNPETTIPFVLGEDLFVDGHGVTVSIRIYNILSQVVAYPVALGHPSGQGREVDQLEYTRPGRYEAFWDGTDTQGRQVSSGIYLMQLTVNNLKPLTRKMYVMK
jgi:hypothetical protein